MVLNQKKRVASYTTVGIVLRAKKRVPNIFEILCKKLCDDSNDQVFLSWVEIFTLSCEKISTYATCTHPKIPLTFDGMLDVNTVVEQFDGWIKDVSKRVQIPYKDLLHPHLSFFETFLSVFEHVTKSIFKLPELNNIVEGLPSAKSVATANLVVNDFRLSEPLIINPPLRQPDPLQQSISGLFHDLCKELNPYGEGQVSMSWVQIFRECCEKIDTYTNYNPLPSMPKSSEPSLNIDDVVKQFDDWIKDVCVEFKIQFHNQSLPQLNFFITFLRLFKEAKLKESFSWPKVQQRNDFLPVTDVESESGFDISRRQLKGFETKEYLDLIQQLKTKFMYLGLDSSSDLVVLINGIRHLRTLLAEKKNISMYEKEISAIRLLNKLGSNRQVTPTSCIVIMSVYINKFTFKKMDTLYTPAEALKKFVAIMDLVEHGQAVREAESLLEVHSNH